VITVSRRPLHRTAISGAVTGSDMSKPADAPPADDTPPARDTATAHDTGARGRPTRRSRGRRPFTPATPTAAPEFTTVIGTNGPIGPLLEMANVSGRLPWGSPRARGIPSIDVIEFVAACPTCGRDVTWIEEREETRLRIIIECTCAR
jgi:hypothetical protein